VKSIVIQIGNTDNKLTQAEWSLFCADLAKVVTICCGQVYFSGHSLGDAPWQNHCVVTACNDLGWLKVHLEDLCKKYRQDSIGLIVGSVAFIGPDDAHWPYSKLNAGDE
jgi:hypothetical protein